MDEKPDQIIEHIEARRDELGRNLSELETKAGHPDQSTNALTQARAYDVHLQNPLPEGAPSIAMPQPATSVSPPASINPNSSALPAAPREDRGRP